MFFRNRAREGRAQVLIEWAEAQLGYRARPLKDSAFGKNRGANGLDWNGSFIQAGLENSLLTTGVSHVSTSAALAHYFHVSQLRREPQVGDLVFFHVSADPTNPLGQPHIGLVVDTRDWRRDGSFHTIEAQVAPEAKQANQDPTAVARRVRYSTDVLAFARPDYQDLTIREEDASAPTVRLARFHVRGSSRDISRAQLALHSLFPQFRGADQGKLDRSTLSAFNRYRRFRGQVIPTEHLASTVKDLGTETGQFRTE